MIKSLQASASNVAVLLLNSSNLMHARWHLSSTAPEQLRRFHQDLPVSHLPLSCPNSQIAFTIPRPSAHCVSLVLLPSSEPSHRGLLSLEQPPDLHYFDSFLEILPSSQWSAQMVGLISAAGLIGFLSEPDLELRVFALKQLDSQVDLLWTEIANSISQM